MQNNDIVPVGVVVAIFAVIGVLVVASFGFAGWSLLQFRNMSLNAVLALGKNVQAVANDTPEDIEYVHLAEPGELVIEAHGQPVSFGESSPVAIGHNIFVPVRSFFEAMGYLVN